MVVGRLLSLWEGLSLGAMLVFGRVCSLPLRTLLKEGVKNPVTHPSKHVAAKKGNAFGKLQKNTFFHKQQVFLVSTAGTTVNQKKTRHILGRKPESRSIQKRQLSFPATSTKLLEKQLCNLSGIESPTSKPESFSENLREATSERRVGFRWGFWGGFC